MKTTLTTLLLFLTLSTHAQVTRDSTGNFRDTVKWAETPHDSATTYTYADKDGRVYPVYVGRKGGLYVWIRKDGVLSKKYMPRK